MLTKLKEFIFGKKQGTTVYAVNVPPPLVDTSAQIRGTTVFAATALNQSHVTKPAWYAIDSKEANTLTQNFIRDFIWALLSYLAINARFEKTDSFWGQTLMQILGSLGVVGITTPFTSYIWSKIYSEDYKPNLTYSSIAACSVIASIFGWNGFSYLGTQFFTNKGYDATTAAYLTSTFPQPGAAEGIAQIIVTNFLSFLFDPNHKFDGVAFGLGFTPINYVTGNLWLVLYTALMELAQENPGTLVAMCVIVAGGVAVGNYATYKTINALSELIHSCLKNDAPTVVTPPTVNQNNTQTHMTFKHRLTLFEWHKPSVTGNVINLPTLDSKPEV